MFGLSLASILSDHLPDDDPLAQSRATAARLLTWLFVCVLPVPAALAFWMGGPWMICLIGAALAGLLKLGTRGGSPALARLGLALGLSTQPMLLSAALSGHPWQLDSHMAFFAMLAIIVMLIDIPALLLAAGVIAVHHLTLTLSVPALVYPDAPLLENLGRTAFHGALVVGQTAALVFTVHVRLKTHSASLAAQAAAEAARQEAEQAVIRSEAALSEAEEARNAAQHATETAEQARTRAEAEAEKVRAADQEARRREAEVREATQAEAAARERMIAELGDGLQALSQGRLGLRLEQPFEPRFEALRKNFNAATEDLFNTMSGVHEQGDGIGSDTTEIAASVETLAARTEKQAASLGRVAEGMSALSDRIETAADSARGARRTVATAQDDAQRTQDTVQQAVDAMAQIEESAGQINRIISVIDEIAFQTNLLALNAGVEAARAGESGRGFAVVASEVRALAQRSSDAAAEIANLISRSGEQVSKGVGLVHDTGDAISRIRQQIGSIVEQVDDIAQAATNQAETVKDMNVALVELDGFTQQNAAMFEEASAATTALAGRARQLAQTIARFIDDSEQQDVRRAG